MDGSFTIIPYYSAEAVVEDTTAFLTHVSQMGPPPPVDALPECNPLFDMNIVQPNKNTHQAS
ncbi:hypothetical protein AB4043_17275 [Terriglobus sp. YAF25]|uniref:hypothetical protein n=1 Tax=unclassified Terriglobus TaxID=2628988 RepID=UPI003F9D6D35